MKDSYGKKKGKSANTGSGKRRSGYASGTPVKHEDIEGVTSMPKGMARVSPRSASAK